MNHVATTCENKLQFKSCLHFNTHQCYKFSGKKTHFTEVYHVVLFLVSSSSSSIIF